MSLKRKLTFVVVAIVVAASAAGAYAATQTSPAMSRQAFLNDVAKRLHVTPQQLRSAFQGAMADRLAAAVKAGRLTKAEAAAIQKRLYSIHAVPFGGFGWFAPGPGYGPGVQVLPGGGPPAVALPRALRAFKARHGNWVVPLPGVGHLRRGLEVPRWFGAPPAVAVRPGALPGPGFFAFGLLMPSTAKAALAYLGLTPAKLRSELRSGKSLAQIARAQGKTAAGLEAAIAGAIRTQLNRQVAAKHIPAAFAKKVEAMLAARVAAVIQRPWAGLMMAVPFRMMRPGIWVGPPKGGAEAQRAPVPAPFFSPA